MSFQIHRGLFALDFTDHYAILGIAIDADVKDIRKRYLKIARRLHPDSCASESEADKQLAEQLLSKLVNPSWESLSQDRVRTEYGVVLKLKGQGAAQRMGNLEVGSTLAQQLLNANSPDHFYRNALQDLAARQYDHLDQVLEITSQISELNLMYLVKKDGNGAAAPARKAYAANTPPAPPAAKAAKPEPTKQEILVDQFYRRAEGYLKKENLIQATVELRDALKIEPNNSRCHSLMGMVYLKQNQPTMAKIHFNKALELDPNDAIAKEGKQKLEPQSAPPASPKSAKNDDRRKPNGGLFGGLFGGKKK